MKWIHAQLFNSISALSGCTTSQDPPDGKMVSALTYQRPTRNSGVNGKTKLPLLSITSQRRVNTDGLKINRWCKYHQYSQLYYALHVFNDFSCIYRLPIQNQPLPLTYPKELDYGIWGGEAIVQGFKKKGKYRTKVAKFWVPALRRSVVYSQVLDSHMKTTVTMRTIDLIHENYGFDHYLLKVAFHSLTSG